MEHVAAMLDMAYIRVLEVATFYFMFQLQPVGSLAHIQVCGTTSCMICGAEDLIGACKEKIAVNAHELSADGKFSWEEVECLGACANAPIAQIGKDYYEDLTAERMAEIIDELAAGKVPTPGPQNSRFASEPLYGLTSLEDGETGHTKHNASVQLAVDIKDTIKRIDGTEVPLNAPWMSGNEAETATIAGVAEIPVSKTAESGATSGGAESKGAKPSGLDVARDGTPDDLKAISGVGPKLETLLNSLGVYHFDQIASWSEAEIAWVDENLEGFKGRVSRDEWVRQAKELSETSDT
jgi:NADH-quinone oxidoreductase subunit E